MKERRKIQKVMMGIAVINYFAAITCAVVAAYMSNGAADSVVADMMESLVLFAGAGIVFHVIGSTNLPGLKIERKRT